MAKNWWEESTLESAAPKNESADEWWSGAKLENAPKRTWGEAIKDTGAQLAEGVNTTLGAIPSVVAPQSKAAGFFRDNAEHWRDQQSDVLKGRIAETDKRIQEAGKDGVLSQIGTAASEYWNDPAQAARLAATNLPSMAATLGTGAAAGLAAKGVAAARGLDAANKAALAAKYGTTTAAATNAALNAGGARGEAFEDLQKAAIAQGMTPEQAEQAGVSGSILPGVVGGVAGAISGKIGLEKAILGQATTGAAMRKAAGAFGAELAGEQIEELAPKVATNYQVGRIDPGRTLTDDLGRTMVETAIGSGPGAVVAGGASAMRTGETPPPPGAGEPTTSPGAADPDAPTRAPGTPPEAPDLTTAPGAGVARDGMDFTREVDTSGLSLQDPAELERARAATVDYQPGDTTPQWDTQLGATGQRQGLDMPAPEFDTGSLGNDARTPSERMGINPAAGALSRAAAVAVDSGATPVQFLGATGRDLQARATGPGVTNESNVIDVQGRLVEDRAISTPRRLTDQQDGMAARAQGDRLAFQPPAAPSAVPALGGPVGADAARGGTTAVPDGVADGRPGGGSAAGNGTGAAEAGAARAGGRGNSNPALSAPTNLREGLARMRARRQEAADAQTAAQSAPTSAPAISAAGTGAVEAAGVKPAGQQQLSANEQAAQDREEARAKELSLPPVLSARLQEAHKAHGRDVKRSVVERGIANEKANNTGTPKAKRERADRIARLEADLALFDEAAAMPPKEAAGVGAALVIDPVTRQPATSWVLRDKSTGAVVMETSQKSVADNINTAKYEAVPIGQHLASLSSPQTSQGAPANVPQPAQSGTQASQTPSTQGAAQAAQAGVAPRPKNWRTSMLGATPVAKAMGIDTKGKRLAQVVAEIDARDTQAPATPAPAPTTGPTRLGRDNTPLSEGGKPFKTRKAAGDAKKLQPMMRVVTVPGGYALAEKTPAQLAAEERAAKRLRTPRTSPAGEPVPAHAFIAASGGLHMRHRNDLGVDGNPRIGNRRLFGGLNRGLSIEQATEMLVADGYLSEGASHNDAYALIKKSLSQPQYNADGIERIAQAESDAQFDDYMAAQEEAAAEGDMDPFDMAGEFTSEELDDVGYTSASPALQAEVNALIAQADAMDIDTFAILEDIARTYANATQDQYDAAARDALAAAIARSNQDGGSVAAQAAPAAEPAAEQGLNQPDAPAALELAAQTPAQAAARQDAQEQAEKSQAAAKRAADAAAKAEDERKRIAQASVRAADRFELGQDPMDSLTGQGSMFDDAPAQQAPTTAVVDDDGRERFTLSIEMFGDVPYRASKPVDAGSGEVVSSRVITTKTKLTAANAQALGLPKDKGTVYAWRVSVIRRTNGAAHSVIEAMATDNGRSPDGEVFAHFKEVENPEAMERIAPAIANAALSDWRAAQPQQAPTTTEAVAQPITRADVTAAQQQAAAIITERIDAMTAGEVNTIARRFLPTMGVRPTVSKERNKAAVTDFTKVNPLAAADEFGATLPADVLRALQADMEGRVTGQDGLMFSRALAKRLDKERGDVMFSFAGQQAATADTMALATAQKRLDAGEDAEAVRQDTGWFKGTDGKWRFEINDADARLKDRAQWTAKIDGINAKLDAALQAKWQAKEQRNDFLRASGESPSRISSETKKTPEFKALAKALKNAEAAAEKAQDAAFLARQGDSLITVGDVLSHPALFAAYPGIADVRVDINDSLPANNAAYAYELRAIELSGKSDAQQLLSTLLHEIQHGIQHIEGFAMGGNQDSRADVMQAVSQQRSLWADVYAVRRELDAGKKLDAVLEEWQEFLDAQPSAEALRIAQDPELETSVALQNMETLERQYAQLRNEGRGDTYRRLAGEVEARNTQARQGMTDEQRRATPPSQTADVADSRVIVMFNGKEMANAPMPANAAPDAATTAQPLRTPAATIRAAISKAYGKLLGQLEAKGLVTLAQTEAQAIEAAAQARADKTGGDVAQMKRSLTAAMQGGTTSQNAGNELLFARAPSLDKNIPAFGDIRKPRESLGDVANALSNTTKVLGNRTVSMNLVAGMISTSVDDMVRAKELASKLMQPDAFFERVILDDAGNVIEGQHRVAALRILGAKAIPAVVIKDYMRDFDEIGIGEAVRAAQKMGGDQANQIVGMLAEIYADENGDMAEVALYEPPRGYEKAWQAGIDQLNKGKPGLDIKRSANGAVQGFFDPQTGQSFLIADNLTAEAAPGVLMHEVGIHMAADGSMKALFNRAAMMLKLQRGNPFMKAVQDRMDAAGETSGEEAAAYIAEAYENDRANAPASVQRWLADLLAAVKAWMFKKGIMGADRLTVADIAAVARANARSMARDGGATGGQGFGTAFSRAPAGDQTQTDSFKRWFKNSKVVDAEGKPLRVFHGTGGDFSVFSRDRAGATTGAANAGMGFFFTDNAEVAGNYARMSREPQSIMPVYLSLQNPLRMEAKNMMEADRLLQSGLKENNDGAIITVAMRDGGTQTVYMTRESNQVKSATGNNRNFDPADADIRFSRASTAGVAARMGDAIKSVTATNIKQRAGFKLTDYLGLGLQALGRRQIVDIYGDMLPLAEYNTLVTQMEADKNEGGAEADKLVTRWAELPDEGKLADLMHEATLAQIDPAKPYVGGDDKAKYAMLAGRFNALSQEAKQVYTDTRDAYQAHHAKVRSAIKERIERSELKGPRKAELLKQMDDEFFAAVKGVYFPLARFGQYAVTVKGADGKVESVSRAETKAEAEALRNNLLSAFPRDKGFTVGRVMLSKDFIADRDAVGRGFMTELYQVLDKQDMDAAQRAELEDTLGQLYLSSLPDLSWAKHGIHRKGTPGFSQDARRAYAQNMFHGSRYLAKLRYSDLMQDELTAMQKHVDDWREVEDFDQNSAQRVVDEMNKRHESLMNPKSNALSTALTSFGFVFHLGLSPASAMVNLSQTALVAYPIMGAKWGFGKASAALLKASAEATKGKNDITGSLNADERAAYDEAVRAGTIDVTMAHDLAGISQGEDAGVMWKIRPVMRWASFMFHHAERFNRQVTFVAAYRLAREAGADQKAAYEQATKATYDGHFDYGAANRPRIMQGNVAKVLLLFKQYGQNMVYTLVRNAQQSLKGATPEERAQARKALGGLLAMHGLAAGALGLPMVTTLLAAASMLGGDDDEPWDAKVALQNMLADTFGQKPAEVLAHGLSRLTPWDISGRVGLDKLIFPDLQEGLEGQRLGESAMAAALGPVAGIGINVLKGIQEMSEGRYLRGLETMAPSVARGPLKALRYGDEGVRDKTGIVVQDEVDAASLLGQAAGFSPSSVRNSFEGKSAIVQHDRALQARRSALVEQFAMAAMAWDEEGKAAAREDITRFNEKNPNQRIQAMQLAQSVAQRQKRIREAQKGVYLPSKRRDALEAGRFAVAD